MIPHKCKIRIHKEPSEAEPGMWLGWDWQCHPCNDGAVFWYRSHSEAVNRALLHLKTRELRHLGLVEETVAVINSQEGTR